MRLVVGLGNPGRKYARTRHNAGFLVVERLASRWGLDVSRKQLGALVGEGRVRDIPVLLALPQSFMNLSGQPVRGLLDFYKGAPQDVLVVHDEVDLPFGTLRLKSGGGHGGHNGLRDLVRHVGADFGRLRFGVSRPPEGWDTADYVLGAWTADEEARLPDLVDRACDALEATLKDGLLPTMNSFNTRGGAAGSPLASANGDVPASKRLTSVSPSAGAVSPGHIDRSPE